MVSGLGSIGLSFVNMIGRGVDLGQFFQFLGIRARPVFGVIHGGLSFCGRRVE